MNRKLLAGSVLLGALVLGAVLGLSEDEPPRWSRSVSEFLAHPTYDRTVRLNGMLVPNTLCKMPDRCEHRFQISDPTWPRPPPAALPVRYEGCLVPDTFRDMPGRDVSVSLKGELCSGCHTFEATEIMAKCPARYEMYRDGGQYHGFPAPMKTCNARGEPNM